MAEQAQPKQKKPIQILRERMGGLSDKMKAYLKDQRFVKSKVTAALKQGPKTVSEIAAETGIESPVVMWHLMAMKKYGAVEEGTRKGDYFLYKLKD
jgi:DNA-binding transcriptional ArsR family regulator